MTKYYKSLHNNLIFHHISHTLFYLYNDTESFSEFHMEILFCNQTGHASSDWINVRILDDFGRVCQKKRIKQKQPNLRISKYLECDESLNQNQDFEELRNVQEVYFKCNKNRDDKFCIQEAKLRIESWKEEYHIKISGNGVAGKWNGPYLTGMSMKWLKDESLPSLISS